MTEATFESCIMIGVDLFAAQCKGIKLFGGTLEDACLIRSDFSDAILINVDFENVLMFFTNFRGTGLGLLRNFDKIKFGEIPEEMKEKFPPDFHPIDVDIQCIERTAEMQVKFGGNNELNTTPSEAFASFLEKNGMSNKITKAYFSMLESEEKKFQSVFISYSTSDQAFADSLYNELRKSGIHAWYAPKNMIGGKTIHEQVRSAIQSYDRILLVLSDNSIKSKWVATEITHAYSQENTNKKHVLFPISITQYETLKDWTLFDSDEGTDLARYIRSFYVPDFSKWQSEEDLRKSVNKLVEALRLNKGQNVA